MCLSLRLSHCHLRLSHFLFRLALLSNELGRQLSCFCGVHRRDGRHLRPYLLRVAKFRSWIIVDEEISFFFFILGFLHPQKVAKKFIVRNDLLMSCWNIISLLGAEQGSILRCKQKWLVCAFCFIIGRFLSFYGEK